MDDLVDTLRLLDPRLDPHFAIGPTSWLRELRLSRVGGSPRSLPGMPSDVLAATLLAPGRLELRHYPYPEQLEPGAVLLRMLASGICGTDKHTFRGETQQYAGTDHASSTPFPIIQGHENVGVVADDRRRRARPRSTARRWRSATASCPRPTGRAANASTAAATSRTTSAGGSRTTATR